MDRKTRTDSIFAIIFGFIIGVFAASFYQSNIFLVLFIIFLGCAVLLTDKLRSRLISRESLLISLVLIASGLGIFRYEIKDYYVPLKPSETGIVISEPEQRENTTRFVFKADNGEKVLVNTDLYSHVLYGDRVKVSGKPVIPGLIENDDGLRVFDYGKYLAKDDIYLVLNFVEVEIVSRQHGNPLKNFLFKIKNSFTAKIKEILAEPYASLLSGLIVSGKGAMPRDILEEFRRAGIIHIVVLSGYNITIIAEFIRRFFQSVFLATRARFALPLSIAASVFAILGFVLMTGAEATVVRASIMVLVVIVAKMLGKIHSAPRALLIAGFLMVIHNPKILVFDPSFQLSFLATLGLVYAAPLFERIFKQVPEKFGFRIILSTTLATQLFVLPFIIYSIGDFSLVSLLSNLLVLAVIPLTMLLGFLATLLAYLGTIFALPLAYLAHILLAWILFVASTLGNLSLASISVPPISPVALALFYLILALIFWRLKNYSQHSPN